MSENSVIETGRLIYSKCHTVGAWSGPGTTAIAANAVVGAIRNVGPAELLVDSIDMAWFTTVVSTVAPLSMAFAVYKVPGFTALANTGARVVPPVPVRKRTADHIVLPAANNGDPKFDTAVQVQVALTGALTGLTLSPALLADDPLAVFIPRTVLIGATAAIYEGQYRWEPKDWVPETLGVDEGLVFTSRAAFPTSVAGQFFMGAELRIS